MTDILTPEQRRYNMSRIRGRDTRPEMILRRGLHAKGFRFRLHRRDLPGRPDLTFPGLQTVVFVNGCFWHGHDCPLYRLPATRTEFWQRKVDRNRKRDVQAAETLLTMGWKVLVVWECALRGTARLPAASVIERAAGFLTNEPRQEHITGDWPGGWRALRREEA